MAHSIPFDFIMGAGVLFWSNTVLCTSFFVIFEENGGKGGLDDTFPFILLCGHAETDKYIRNVRFGASWMRK